MGQSHRISSSIHPSWKLTDEDERITQTETGSMSFGKGCSGLRRAFDTKQAIDRSCQHQNLGYLLSSHFDMVGRLLQSLQYLQWELKRLPINPIHFNPLSEAKERNLCAQLTSHFSILHRVSIPVPVCVFKVGRNRSITVKVVVMYITEIVITVNMPKQRVFSACCAPFSLVIHKVFLRKNGFSRRKNPSLLVIFPVFR